MNHYHLWFDLRDGTRDLDACHAIEAYLDHMRDEGLLDAWTLARRKLGFGPSHLGEFHCCIQTSTLAQLDDAFDAVRPRSGRVEQLHAGVWSKVKNLQTALYRTFPDREG